MKTVNATEVARNFSEVLDGVEHRHHTYVVTRGGKPIARIAPVPSANGTTPPTRRGSMSLRRCGPV